MIFQGQDKQMFNTDFLQINVTVSTVESDLDFAIQPNTLGKNLFDQVLDVTRFNFQLVLSFDMLILKFVPGMY